MPHPVLPSDEGDSCESTQLYQDLHHDGGRSRGQRASERRFPLRFPGPHNDKENGMNILVLTGSPRMHGNSNTLADHFIRGAKDSGHSVARFDAAHKNVHACTACNSCKMNGPCVFDDDFTFVRRHLVKADLVAFVTPMYYFGISSQLKTVIDRFYAVNSAIHVKKRAVLLMTYANHSDKDERPILTHYDVLLDYLGWEDAGRIIVPGVWIEGAVNRTPFLEHAYRLGRGLHKDGEPVL